MSKRKDDEKLPEIDFPVISEICLNNWYITERWADLATKYSWLSMLLS